MIDFLTDLGMKAWDPFWVPVLVWTAVTIAVALALRVVPRRQTRLHLDVRLALLLALPLGLLIANLLPLTQQQIVYVISLPAPAAAPASVVAAPVAASATISIYTLIGGVTVLVFALSALGVIRFVGACVGLRRLLTSATPIQTEALSSIRSLGQKESDELSRVCVLISRHAPVAFSCGLFSRKIVLPLATDPEERLVLIHELAHHLNGDIWRATIGQFVTSLFFFHPLVHLMHRDTRLLVELACDEQVLVDSGVDRQQYAKLLLRYAGQGSFKPTPALSMSDTHSHLQRRIHAMKTPFRKALGRRSVIAIAMLVLGAGIFVSACSESAMVASDDESATEENDIRARTFALPPTTEPDVFVIVDTPPRLIGGLTGLQEKLEYPSAGCPDTVMGRVFLQFVVDSDGSVNNVLVTRGLGEENRGCDRAAVSVVKQAAFIPGSQDGKRVPVKMSLPVTFKSDNPNAIDPFSPTRLREQLDNGTFSFDPMNWRIVSDATVTGFVLDRNGNQIHDARIRLIKYPATAMMREGQGYVLRIPHGTWTVEIDANGTTWQETITVGEREQKTLDLRVPESQ